MNSIRLFLTITLLISSISAFAKEGDLLLSCKPTVESQTIDGIALINLIEDGLEGSMSVQVFGKDGRQSVATKQWMRADQIDISHGKIKVSQDTSNVPFVYENILEARVNQTTGTKEWALAKYWVCEDYHFEETCLGTEYILQSSAKFDCK